jgi:hypothetical protein
VKNLAKEIVSSKRSYFTERNQLKIEFSKDIVSPLADPTWSFVFANLETSGLAARSFTEAVIDGFIELKGEIVRVTPQEFINIPGFKSSRVDIDFQTDSNEDISFEIQVKYDKWLDKRNWVSTAATIMSHALSGAKYNETAELYTELDVINLPKIIRINLLCYNIRSSSENLEIVQPVQALYGREPHTVADEFITTFNIQLPRFVELVNRNEVDYSNPLHVWLYIIWQSHVLKKSPKELIEMQDDLKTVTDTDKGLSQYVNRLSNMLSDPDSMKEYAKWVGDLISQRGIIEGAVDDAVAKKAYEDELIIAEIISQKDAEKEAAIAEKDSVIANRDSVIANRDAELARYRAKYGNSL